MASTVLCQPVKPIKYGVKDLGEASRKFSADLYTVFYIYIMNKVVFQCNNIFHIECRNRHVACETTFENIFKQCYMSF